MKISTYIKSKSMLMAAAAVIILGVLAGLNTPELPAAQITSSNAQGRISGQVSGAPPGAKILYELISEGRERRTGQAAAAVSGVANLPAQFLLKNEAAPLYYRLSVERPRGPVDVNFYFDPEGDHVRISGEGLGRYTRIILKGGTERIETKADWAGIFRDLELSGFSSEGQDNEPAEIELALYNNDVLGTVQTGNPLRIKIFTAPGGGTASEEDVNSFSGVSGTRKQRFDMQIQKIVDNYVTALMMMTEQLTGVMMQQAIIIGTFLDAKYQLETQRYFQKLNAEAHKDYHPSEQMCRFGTYVRSISRAEHKAAIDRQAFNKIMMDSYTGSESASTAEGAAIDISSRLRQFRTRYCDPQDNNDGLDFICEHDQDGNPNNGPVGAWDFDTNQPDRERMNKDIDIGRTLLFPLTIDVDFSDDKKTKDEEDVIALAKNLYWPEALGPALPKPLPEKFPDYLDARSLFAVQNVAHNSFANIIAQKARSQQEVETSGWRFMKSMMLDFGLSEEDIDALLGEYPSYYAQMEVLTKKIYQNPDFYTNLYDKPANVARIGATMQAFSLMQQRDYYEAFLRRELLTSLLVEQDLRPHVEKISQIINKLNSETAGKTD